MEKIIYYKNNQSYNKEILYRIQGISRPVSYILYKAYFDLGLYSKSLFLDKNEQDSTTDKQLYASLDSKGVEDFFTNVTLDTTEYRDRYIRFYNEKISFSSNKDTQYHHVNIGLGDEYRYDCIMNNEIIGVFTNIKHSSISKDIIVHNISSYRGIIDDKDIILSSTESVIDDAYSQRVIVGKEDINIIKNNIIYVEGDINNIIKNKALYLRSKNYEEIKTSYINNPISLFRRIYSPSYGELIPVGREDDGIYECEEVNISLENKNIEKIDYILRIESNQKSLPKIEENIIMSQYAKGILHNDKYFNHYFRDDVGIDINLDIRFNTDENGIQFEDIFINLDREKYLKYGRHEEFLSSGQSDISSNYGYINVESNPNALNINSDIIKIKGDSSELFRDYEQYQLGFSPKILFKPNFNTDLSKENKDMHKSDSLFYIDKENKDLSAIRKCYFVNKEKWKDIEFNNVIYIDNSDRDVYLINIEPVYVEDRGIMEIEEAVGYFKTVCSIDFDESYSLSRFNTVLGNIEPIIRLESNAEGTQISGKNIWYSKGSHDFNYKSHIFNMIKNSKDFKLENNLNLSRGSQYDASLVYSFIEFSKVGKPFDTKESMVFIQKGSKSACYDMNLSTDKVEKEIFHIHNGLNVNRVIYKIFINDDRNWVFKTTYPIDFASEDIIIRKEDRAILINDFSKALYKDSKSAMYNFDQIYITKLNKYVDFFDEGVNFTKVEHNFEVHFENIFASSVNKDISTFNNIFWFTKGNYDIDYIDDTGNIWFKKNSHSFDTIGSASIDKLWKDIDFIDTTFVDKAAKDAEYRLDIKWISKPYRDTYIQYDQTWFQRDIYNGYIQYENIGFVKELRDAGFQYKYIFGTKNGKQSGLSYKNIYLTKMMKHAGIQDTYTWSKKNAKNSGYVYRNLFLEKGFYASGYINNLSLRKRDVKISSNEDFFIYNADKSILDPLNKYFVLKDDSSVNSSYDTILNYEKDGKAFNAYNKFVFINKDSKGVYVNKFVKRLDKYYHPVVYVKDYLSGTSNFKSCFEDEATSLDYENSIELYKQETVAKPICHGNLHENSQTKSLHRERYNVFIPFEQLFADVPRREGRIYAPVFVDAIAVINEDDYEIETDGLIDELILPHRDYKYSDFTEELFLPDGTIDFNFVRSFDPNTGEYVITLPLKHPIDIYTDIARNYIDLDVGVLQNIMDFILQIWRRDMFRFAAMTAHDSLIKILKETYNYIQKCRARNPQEITDQQLRCLQLFRWYSEMAILNNCEYVFKYIGVEVAVDYVAKDYLELDRFIEEDNLHISDEYVIEAIDKSSPSSLTIGAYLSNKSSPLEVKFKLYNTGGTASILNIENEVVVNTKEYPVGVHDIHLTVADKARIEFTPTDGEVFITNLSAENLQTTGYKVTYRGVFGETNKTLDELLEKMRIFGDIPGDIKESLKETFPVSVAIDRLYDYFELHHRDKLKGKRLITKK